MAVVGSKSYVGENYYQHHAGYAFEEMVADIIDNSIGAKSKNITIRFEDCDYTAAGSPGGQGKSLKYPEGLGYLTGERSYLMIADDGHGMSYAELLESLTKGAIRDYEDYELGHFGIGLKDSTLSQAYEITIFSKKKGESVAILRMSSIWFQERDRYEFMQPHKDFKNDYDWMAKTDGYQNCKKFIDGIDCGTVILMEGLHSQEKAFGDTHSRSDYISMIVDHLDSHLGLVFERYLDPNPLTR